MTTTILSDHPHNHSHSHTAEGHTEQSRFAVREHHVLDSAADICVLTVHGEIDLATVPLLDAAVRAQLAATPTTTHLIVDVTQVRFLSCAGLRWILDAPDLAQLTGSQLHLSGLVNRVVARPLQLTDLGGLLEVHPALGGLFHLHPTLTHALNALAA